VRRRGVELNLLAGEVAIELVVWDRARAQRSPIAAAEIEAILAAGAPRYQALLASIHAGEDLDDPERQEVDAWLGRSRAARIRFDGKLGVPKKAVKLSGEEQERVDRAHPERSFSGGAAAEAGLPAPGGGADLEAVLLAALEDVRSGHAQEAERTLRRFLSEHP
jgi:hypothetical protein